ncbi:MAG: glycosyltransferase family 4 protein [Burkholderiales bacterium]
MNAMDTSAGPASPTASLIRNCASAVRRLGIVGVMRRAHWVFRREGLHGIAMRLRKPRLAPAPIAEPQAAGARGHPPAAMGANLVGHPYGALGMGEHIRKSAQAFAAAGVPFVIVNTFRQLGPHGDKFLEFPFRSRIVEENPYPISIFHLNADEMPLASAHLGEAFFANRYNVGYWAWELSKFPDAWCSAFRYFYEIWAPSRFIQQAVADKAPGPVIHMPLAVEFATAATLPRRHFGLPEGKFLFLFYFDFTSYVTRKNPFGPLNAFRMAFGNADRGDVALVIKANGMEQRPEAYRAFLDAIGDPGDAVILLDRVMTDHEVRSLVAVCDCFVSLHRSEGFGRGLAEAMYCGKPVIATGYSGNMDFTHEDNSLLVDYTLVPVREGEYPFPEGQIWAEPDTAQAAEHMQRLVADRALGGRIGARAADYIRTHHSFRAIGERYHRRLLKIGAHLHAK